MLVPKTKGNAVSSFEQANPYQAVESANQDFNITSNVLESLRQTRPWVLFLGVLGIIAAVLLVLVAIGMMAFGLIPNAGAAGMPPGMGVGLGIVYLIMAILYIAPSIYLIRYAGHIKTLLASPSTVALEQALQAQKSFWRFVGICMLLVVALYGLLIVVGIAAGVAGMAMQQ